jgi:hypothetical protein
VLRALPLLVLLVASPSTAAAYEQQVSLDLSAGWGVAPVLPAPNNGPAWALSSAIGFDDTWGLGIYAGWAVHPPFNGGESVHVGIFGAEALYYIDILEVVPFFGLGIDVITTFDGNAWGADFAAHLRASVDYLVSREVAIGVDVRPYILFTNLDLDPVYLTFLARVSVLLDY